MTNRDLASAINSCARRIDQFLKTFIEDDETIPNLQEGMIYALGLDVEDSSVRGKRIRPALGMMVCESLGGDPEQIIPFAAAIELFHNFTLVHDDIEDGDTFRRNRPCVYMKYGMAHGINIGDYMLVRVFRALQDYSETIPENSLLKLMELMIDTLEHTHIGQALDINARSSNEFSIEDYFRLVREKTGYCLSASMSAAAILTGSSSVVREALHEYALNIGPLFQIRDDVIDLTEGKGREKTGSDIREGKRSYMVAHVLSSCSREEKIQLYEILDKPRDETEKDEISWVKQLFEKHGSFEAAKYENERLRKIADKALGNLPDKTSELLHSFTGYLVSRKK